jgi:hypothetical protein
VLARTSDNPDLTLQWKEGPQEAQVEVVAKVSQLEHNKEELVDVLSRITGDGGTSPDGMTRMMEATGLPTYGSDELPDGASAGLSFAYDGRFAKWKAAVRMTALPIDRERATEDQRRQLAEAAALKAEFDQDKDGKFDEQKKQGFNQVWLDWQLSQPRTFVIASVGIVPDDARPDAIAGHYFVITGKDEDGYYEVNDPLPKPNDPSAKPMVYRFTATAQSLEEYVERNPVTGGFMYAFAGPTHPVHRVKPSQ